MLQCCMSVGYTMRLPPCTRALLPVLAMALLQCCSCVCFVRAAPTAPVAAPLDQQGARRGRVLNVFDVSNRWEVSALRLAAVSSVLSTSSVNSHGCVLLYK